MIESQYLRHFPKYPSSEDLRKKHDSEQLKRDMEEFLKNGGKIQVVAQGVSGDKWDGYNRK